MSSPYYFSPFPEFQPTPLVESHSPVHSPFIPNVSPYGSPLYHPTQLPASPNFGSAALPNDYESYPAGYNPYQRRPSWQGSIYEPSSPFSPPSEFLSPGGHSRRHSFGGTDYAQSPIYPQSYIPPFQQPSYSPWPSLQYANLPSTPVSPSPALHIQLHPFLDGSAPRADLQFNVAEKEFAPARLVGSTQLVPFTYQNLIEVATNPPLMRMRIVNDAIPQWPIDLQVQAPSPGQAYPAVSLGDILLQIHNSLNQRISHMDWAHVTQEQERRITLAYKTRCHILSRGNREMEQLERADGVKRVDYLSGRVWFRGLVPAGEVMKLIIG